MFTFLKELDRDLYVRYRTLERNIKSASNSFYDAYLDLQEQFIRFALQREGVPFHEGGSVGSLLKQAACRELLLSTVGIDAHTYDKMEDYTRKVNAHKHKQEKRITVDTVLSYVTVIYDATAAYAAFCGIRCVPLNLSVYADMFGAFEKENVALRAECETLREELTAAVEQGQLKDSDAEAVRRLLSAAEPDKLSLEEQNAELLRRISRLKDIKLSTMEEKLNRAIDMLLSLQASVIENRAVSYAVGDTICGREKFRDFVQKAKKDLQNK